MARAAKILILKYIYKKLSQNISDDQTASFWSSAAALALIIANLMNVVPIFHRNKAVA